MNLVKSLLTFLAGTACVVVVVCGILFTAVSMIIHGPGQHYSTAWRLSRASAGMAAIAIGVMGLVVIHKKTRRNRPRGKTHGFEVLAQRPQDVSPVDPSVE